MNTLPAPASQYPPPEYIPADPVEGGAGQGSPIKIHKLLSAARRFWWVPLLTLILGLGAAGGLIYKKEPTFTSRSAMWDTGKLQLGPGSLFEEDAQTAIGTLSELIKGDTMKNLALARLRGNSVRIPLDENGEAVEVPVRVTASSKSRVYFLEATGSNPAYIRAYLDALMFVYIEYRRNTRTDLSGGALVSLNDYLSRAEREFNDQQSLFLDFQRSNNITVVQQEASIAGSYLATQKTKLSELELEDRLLAASILTTAEQQSATNTAGTNSGAVVGSFLLPNAPPQQFTAFQELQVLKAQRDRRARYWKDKHPKMVQLVADIDRAERLLAIYERQSLDQLRRTRADLQLKMENVKSEIAQWEVKVIGANSLLAESEKLRLETDRRQRNFERYTALMEDVRFNREIDRDTLAIYQPANKPERTYTQEIGIAGMGGAGGLGLGIGIILLVAWRDDRFGSVREVTEKLGNGVMGQVPEVIFNGSGPLRLADQDQQHMYAESYRNLRSALLYLGLGEVKPKVLLITSALPDEGKSTVALNLAKTLALGGAKVLLVDGDLRKGSLHKMMALEQSPGFAEILERTAAYEVSLQSNSLPNLRFLASGHRIGNAGDLFLGKTLDELLARWREDFDHVIIDSTPVFAADDAATIAPKVDGTVLVVRNRYSRAAQVREALEVLLQRQAKVIGLVFNRANPKSRAYYYYKYKEYYAAEQSGQSGQ